MPAPPSRVRTTKPTRKIAGWISKYWARPPLTPATLRSERLRCRRRISGICVLLCSCLQDACRRAAATIRNDPESDPETTLASRRPRRDTADLRHPPNGVTHSTSHHDRAPSSPASISSRSRPRTSNARPRSTRTSSASRPARVWRAARIACDGRRVRDRHRHGRADRDRAARDRVQPAQRARSRSTSTTSRPRAPSSSRAASSFLGETIDSGVCHQALFKDPDGNVLDLHHRYAPRT